MRSTSNTEVHGTATSRFAVALMDILEHVEYRRVNLSELNDPVFRLRYDAYRREDFIPANQDEIATDDLDDKPNGMCYGIYIHGELASSIRLHHLTSEHRYSPSMTAYADVLHPMLDKGMHFVDPSRFTADRDLALAYPALPFLTLRLAAMACEYFVPDYCLSSIRQEHAAFYKRVFGSVQWGGVRFLGGGLKFPVCLYAAAYSEIRDRVADRFPFFMSTPEERQAMFGPGNEARYLSMILPTARAAAIAEQRFAPAD
jgi:hypothetical protein